MEETTLSGRIPQKEITRKGFFLKKINIKQISTVIAYVFIILFIYAALRKIVDHKMYYNEISYFPLLVKNSEFPLIHKIGGWAFWLISFSEITAAVMLSNNKWRKIGFSLSFFLIVIITFYLLLIINFSKLIPFYFGAILPNVPIYGHILFNTTLILMLLVPIMNKNN